MFDVTTEEARLLLDVALMATGHNRFKSAATLLAALGEFRPGEASLAVANAILFLSMRDDAGAVSYIEREALPKFSDSAMLRAFYGEALLRTGRRAEAREQLELAAKSRTDPAAAQLARGFLEDGAPEPGPLA